MEEEITTEYNGRKYYGRLWIDKSAEGYSFIVRYGGVTLSDERTYQENEKAEFYDSAKIIFEQLLEKFGKK